MKILITALLFIGLTHISLAGTAPKWTLERTKSEMDDSLSISAYLPAENEVTGLGGQKNRPTLVVQCLQGSTVRLLLLSEVGFDYYVGYSTLTRMRFDDNKAQEQVWNTFSSGDMVSARQPKPLIESITKSKVLKIELTPALSHPQVARFDVEGSMPFIELIAEACKWDIGGS